MCLYQRADCAAHKWMGCFCPSQQSFQSSSRIWHLKASGLDPKECCIFVLSAYAHTLKMKNDWFFFNGDSDQQTNRVNISWYIYQHCFLNFLKCLMSLHASHTLCTSHQKPSKELSLRSAQHAQTPHALSAMCHFLWSSCWEALFKGKVFLKKGVWIGQLAADDLSGSVLN